MHAQPDPRVLTLMQHALHQSIYCPATQMALVQCFTAVFGETNWWRQMLHEEPEVAALVKFVNARTLH